MKSEESDGIFGLSAEEEPVERKQPKQNRAISEDEEDEKKEELAVKPESGLKKEEDQTSEYDDIF